MFGKQKRYYKEIIDSIKKANYQFADIHDEIIENEDDVNVRWDTITDLPGLVFEKLNLDIVNCNCQFNNLIIFKDMITKMITTQYKFDNDNFIENNIKNLARSVQRILDTYKSISFANSEYLKIDNSLATNTNLKKKTIDAINNSDIYKHGHKLLNDFKSNEAFKLFAGQLASMFPEIMDSDEYYLF